MRQFLFIAGNSFRELIRQPVYLLLMSAASLFIVFLSTVPYFGFGDDPKMVEDMSLAVVLLAGLLMSVLCAASTVSQEIRTGTALTVLSKPVGRAVFLLGKFAGLAGALALFTAALMVAVLLASRMAFDAYGDTDIRSLLIYVAAVLVAYAAGGFTNFFLRRPFVSDAVLAYVLCTAAALAIVVNYTVLDRSFDGPAKVDWRLMPAGLLVWFALLVLAALALACSTRLDTIPTLAVCSALFLLGLMSDYLFGGPASQGAWWAQVAYAAIPNWQQFWAADALEQEKTIPWKYVGQAAGYMGVYLVGALAAALWLFEDRELG
ncbi:MAG: ABC transporter permease [Verrucomicrobiae bacterium]|nr:ABC transporter permease [Verrucomicrobiae bacterium]